ncbi:endoplasmic reticulum junction formation protein lunapark isoform X6 [Lepidochelys kempii]|uniref:endoplasmic reticulum junction formation protein lunapark isoform X6 n=1 Tax=Lepidochelys kempii TaxID=8472 RepID=UPI003C6F8F39
MGGLVSRWRQAKASTVEVLEKIDKDIQALEEFREKNQRLQKLWVGRLLLYSSILYLITCLIVYLWYLPDEWTARLIMMLPFFAFPLIIWFIRTVLIFFFSKRTERNSEALEELKSQKKKILEEVMEKETYKTAKLILERFDPESKKAKEVELPSAGASATPRPGQGLHPPGPPLARPILPRDRGALDRVVEYLVGDGPQNRYALICQQCFSHNGMALKEEFEYIAFRCAYCFFLNPARKTRPQAPRLPDFSCEKRQPTELQTTVGPLHSGGVKLQENPPKEEPIEQVTRIIEADQIDGEASSTEQQGVELSEEGVKEETTNENEPSVTKIDSAVPTEQNDEPVLEAE